MKAKKSIIGSAFMIDSYIYEELKLKSTGVRENKKIFRAGGRKNYLLFF
ncbi:hypothetical protein [Fusobacterium nucleatum]|nr:hypothetical protein [Fusobacterium nucleatum]MCG6843146.1 hypothetical protein [Fusobacterium nucleatum]